MACSGVGGRERRCDRWAGSGLLWGTGRVMRGLGRRGRMGLEGRNYIGFEGKTGFEGERVLTAFARIGMKSCCHFWVC